MLPRILAGLLLAGAAVNAQSPDAIVASKKIHFAPGAVVVARLQYAGNTFANYDGFPYIFNNKAVSGVQANVYLDQFYPVAGFPRQGALLLPDLTTSFASRLEGGLTLSPNGENLAYIGISAPVGTNGASTSYTTGEGVNLQTNTARLYDRAVSIVDYKGKITNTIVNNVSSGDVPRAAITLDGKQFYTVGNSDGTVYPDGTGPGTTIGIRYGTVGSKQTLLLGTYTAADRPDETVANHVKDNNFRGISIFNGNLYVSKGSGGNGDNGVFQVGKGLPTTGGNPIVQLLGAPATDPVTAAAGIYTPYDFFFASPTVVYAANEGNVSTDSNGNLIPDPLSGLQKWVLTSGSWRLAYTIQDGLRLYLPEDVSGYPALTYTTGLRHITGDIHPDGTITIYATTGQYSTFSSGAADPNKLVAVNDVIGQTTPTLFTPPDYRADLFGHFFVLQVAQPGQVFRGVAMAPQQRDPWAIK